MNEKVKREAPTTREAAFDLSFFTLESATLEIKYPIALELWDTSGSVWRALQERWPRIVLASADPRKQDFKVDNSRLSIELEAARFSMIDPERSLESFIKDAKEFVRITTKYLRLSTYTRVGFRLQYFKEYKDKSDANDAFLSLNLLRIPNSKKFEIEAPPSNAHYVVRWESDKKGVLLQVRCETRKIDIEPPAEAVRYIKAVHKETYGLVFDCDYYTVAPVEPGQMDTAEWAKHAIHIVSRDTRYIFEG